MGLDDASKALADSRDNGPFDIGISAVERRRREAACLPPRLGFPGEDSLSVTDTSFPGPASQLDIRIYRPERQPGQQLSVLLYLHGGGFIMGSLDTHDNVCRAFASATPCCVVAVNYRLAPEHKFPRGLEDSFATLQWVGSHLEQLGATDGKIAVAGDSAGGNLAAGVAILARDERGPALAHMFLAYPCLEARHMLGEEPRNSFKEITQDTKCLVSAEAIYPMFDMYFTDPSEGRDPRYALLNANLANLPPTFIATAEADPLRDEGHALANALKASGVDVEFWQTTETTHGFISYVTQQGRDTITEAAARMQAAFGM